MSLNTSQRKLRAQQPCLPTPLMNQLYSQLKKEAPLAERQQLQRRYDSMTNQRDQLQQEVERLNKKTRETCRQGWRSFGSSCYYVSAGKADWQTSRLYCGLYGGDLAVINSREEQMFINGLLNEGSEAWIGLTDTEKEGTWTWVDKTPLTTSYWASGRPDSHQGRLEDCAEFWSRPGKVGEWNDEVCSVNNQRICEK